MSGLGPVLVLAGPGSGKTFTIIQRIKFLIQNHIDPSNILVLTFSKSAAIELQTRFQKEEGNCPVYFGTFHSVFYQIIKESNRLTNLKIITISQKRKIIKNIIQNYALFDVYEQELLDLILNLIASFKNNGEIYKMEESIITKEKFHLIYAEYQQILSLQNSIDFEDMLNQCYKILKNDPERLKYFQNKFRYILIDEYQDINNIQYEIIKLLTYPEQHIFAVGDDDQAIYGFRGSKPDIMQRFNRDFSNAKIIKLVSNYRSSKNIIEFADSIIRENTIRFQKEMISMRGEVLPVRIKKFQNKEEEANYLIDELKQKQQMNQLKDTALLYRTNREASIIAEILLKYKIPFSIREKLRNSYQSFIFKDIFHYMKLSESNGEFLQEDFLAVMNKPLRYFSRSAIISKIITIEGLYEFYKEKAYMFPIIQRFDYDLKRMKGMDLFSKVNYIRKAIGYDEYLEEIAFNNHISVERYMQEISSIQEKMKMFYSMEELIKHMDKMEQLESKQNNFHEKDKDGVNIMTFHSAKGLEFRNVYIPECNEGIIPYKRSNGIEEIEEERRMFYVGLTRAKEELTVLYVHGNRDSLHMPSRFLKDIIKKGI